MDLDQSDQALADEGDAEPEELGTESALSAVDPDQSDQAPADERDAEPKELGIDAADLALSTVEPEELGTDTTESALSAVDLDQSDQALADERAGSSGNAANTDDHVTFFVIIAIFGQFWFEY